MGQPNFLIRDNKEYPIIEAELQESETIPKYPWKGRKNFQKRFPKVPPTEMEIARVYVTYDIQNRLENLP